MSNFEDAERNACREVFSDAKLLGCWFHFAQVFSFLWKAVFSGEVIFWGSQVFGRWSRIRSRFNLISSWSRSFKDQIVRISLKNLKKLPEVVFVYLAVIWHSDDMKEIDFENWDFTFRAIFQSRYGVHVIDLREIKGQVFSVLSSEHY